VYLIAAPVGIVTAVTATATAASVICIVAVVGITAAIAVVGMAAAIAVVGMAVVVAVGAAIAIVKRVHEATKGSAMTGRRKQFGDFGERMAAAYLTQRGFTLLAQQWRCAAGEIDLVMRDGDELVFIEVRARRGVAGLAAESVSRRKRARLVALAYTYLETEGLPEDTPWRIDVVALTLNSAGQIREVTHIRNAVEE
jgi:putative endonuclease